MIDWVYNTFFDYGGEFLMDLAVMKFHPLSEIMIQRACAFWPWLCFHRSKMIKCQNNYPSPRLVVNIPRECTYLVLVPLTLIYFIKQVLIFLNILKTQPGLKGTCPLSISMFLYFSTYLWSIQTVFHLNCFSPTIFDRLLQLWLLQYLFGISKS